jgi:hypothetical protein
LIDADQSGNASYEAAPQAQQSIVVGIGSQTIYFLSGVPVSAVVGGAYKVTATATSRLPVSFSSGTPAVCSIEGSTVSFVAGGVCMVDANQAGDSDYEPAVQGQQEFLIAKNAQQIEFTSHGPGAATVAGPAYTVSASASSGLPVTLSSGAPEICTVTGATVAFVGAGQCIIEADEPGSTSYEAAVPITQAFAVAKGSQMVEFTSHPPASATVGGSGYVVSAVASSGLPASITAATPSVCSLEGSIVSFVSEGICSFNAYQAGNANYETAVPVEQSFNVSAALVLKSGPFASSSSFSVHGNPTVSSKTGAITFTMSAGGTGTVHWLLTFQNGRFGAFAASTTKCKTNELRLLGRCLPARVIFSKGSKSATAGTVSITVRPSAAARTALRNAQKQAKGLPVTVALSFQPSYGAAVSQTRAITVRLRRGK